MKKPIRYYHPIFTILIGLVVSFYSALKFPLKNNISYILGEAIGSALLSFSISFLLGAVIGFILHKMKKTPFLNLFYQSSFIILMILLVLFNRLNSSAL